MDVIAVLERLDRLGVSVQLDGPDLILRPGSRVSADVLEEVKACKPEIVNLLQRPRLVNGPPGWHAEKIAERVAIEGVCVFWSEVLEDIVAFCRTEEDRARIPAGIVGYSIEELTRLFGPGEVAESTLRLIHHAKKLGGGRVLGNDPAGTQLGDSRP